MVPKPNPVKISRRQTRHQSRRRTCPSAMARITRVVAWDPELPPLLMINGTNRASTTDRKSTRLNSSHRCISYAVFCLKKKKKQNKKNQHNYHQQNTDR